MSEQYVNPQGEDFIRPAFNREAITEILRNKNSELILGESIIDKNNGTTHNSTSIRLDLGKYSELLIHQDSLNEDGTINFNKINSGENVKLTPEGEIFQRVIHFSELVHGYDVETRLKKPEVRQQNFTNAIKNPDDLTDAQASELMYKFLVTGFMEKNTCDAILSYANAFKDLKDGEEIPNYLVGRKGIVTSALNILENNKKSIGLDAVDIAVILTGKGSSKQIEGTIEKIKNYEAPKKDLDQEARSLSRR